LFLEQEDGVDVTANSLHPGAIITNLFRHNNIVNGMHFIESHYKHGFFGVN
jgi:hypothetical protein